MFITLYTMYGCIQLILWLRTILLLLNLSWEVWYGTLLRHVKLGALRLRLILGLWLDVLWSLLWHLWHSLILLGRWNLILLLRDWIIRHLWVSHYAIDRNRCYQHSRHHLVVIIAWLWHRWLPKYRRLLIWIHEKWENYQMQLDNVHFISN